MFYTRTSDLPLWNEHLQGFTTDKKRTKKTKQKHNSQCIPEKDDRSLLSLGKGLRCIGTGSTTRRPRKAVEEAIQKVNVTSNTYTNLKHFRHNHWHGRNPGKHPWPDLKVSKIPCSCSFLHLKIKSLIFWETDTLLSLIRPPFFCFPRTWLWVKITPGNYGSVLDPGLLDIYTTLCVSVYLV